MKKKPRIWYSDFCSALVDIMELDQREIEKHNDSIDSLFKSLKKQFKNHVKENFVDIYEDDI